MFSIKPKQILGYIYVSDQSNDQRFLGVKSGSIVTNASRKPPYFVVQHRAEKVIITEWPGRLFKVSTCDNYRRINKEILPYAEYTRSNKIEIVEELEVSTLFGEKGKEIIEIVDSANSITKYEAQTLSKQLTLESCQLYSTIWKRWLDQNKVVTGEKDNFVGTTGFHSNYYDDLPYSPLGNALSIIGNLLYKRVREIDWDEGIVTDNEDETNLSPLWAKAQQILLNAAISKINDGLLNSSEIEILIRPFNQLKK